MFHRVLNLPLRYKTFLLLSFSAELEIYQVVIRPLNMSEVLASLSVSPKTLKTFLHNHTYVHNFTTICLIVKSLFDSLNIFCSNIMPRISGLKLHQQL